MVSKLPEISVTCPVMVTFDNAFKVSVTSPTNFNPSDMSHKTQVFMGELLAARLINFKTGEIYTVQLEWVFRSREAFL